MIETDKKKIKNKVFKQKFVLVFLLFLSFCLIFASAGVSYAYLSGKFSSDITYNNPSGGLEVYYNSSTKLSDSSTIVLTISSAGSTLKVNGTAISGTTSDGATTFNLPISIKNSGNVPGVVTSFSITTSSSSKLSLSGVSFTTASGFTMTDGVLLPSSGGDLQIPISQNSQVSVITAFVVDEIALSCVGEHTFVFHYEFHQN